MASRANTPRSHGLNHDTQGTKISTTTYPLPWSEARCQGRGQIILRLPLDLVANVINIPTAWRSYIPHHLVGKKFGNLVQAAVNSRHAVTSFLGVFGRELRFRAEDAATFRKFPSHGQALFSARELLRITYTIVGCKTQISERERHRERDTLYMPRANPRLPQEGGEGRGAAAVLTAASMMKRWRFEPQPP